MDIAIIGSGISGLTAAHHLDGRHDVTVFEAGSYVGGHTNTVHVETDRGAWDVDTGFIVCNDHTYPNFLAMMDELGVARRETHMGFSVTAQDEDFEYAGTPRGLFCQPRNAVRPAFLRMIRDLLRFNRELTAIVADPTDARGDLSLLEFLARGGYSDSFRDRLIVPQASAVWSAEPEQLDAFPVRFMAQFFANHGMLSFRNRPTWMTIEGGSQRYVEALTERLARPVRIETPVTRVQRFDTHVEVTPQGGEPERFDEVLFACHADQALRILGADATETERELLRCFPYQPNEAVLHTDEAMLPRRRAARQAWNFHLLGTPKDRATVTYGMNHLMGLDAPHEFCVTLNLTERIDPAKIIEVIDYAHPVFTTEGVAAQARHGEISGRNRTHYAGAYWRWGFHEDGVFSALQALEHVGRSEVVVPA
ncbi:NAD(P)/FAD-dependent oxidoreductase [Paraconexibacter sp.]|uniref:NAD(P)/FAD-dependent oxidoreductase n=1 Tax=Paraconexibacter sp. TaxID=2949640 RepID=UPI003562C235